MNAALGHQSSLNVISAAVDLSLQGTVSLALTMSKTQKISRGVELNIDMSEIESRGVTNYNDSPIQPGEKVDRFRFMSYYLEGSTKNFDDFFEYVVDPEWLASNDEEARALRQAQKFANKAWRVLHRVTYVERPALADFGRDVRSVTASQGGALETDLSSLRDKIRQLQKENTEIKDLLNQILQKVSRQ
ncbi:MAG: hypothetical protein IPN69_02170 [Acidobacteria bacterium]|nr:hypothetical protein [Acidobacteriota bacterium]